MGLSESGGVPNLEGAPSTVYERTVMPLFCFIRDKDAGHRNYLSFATLQHLSEGLPAFNGLDAPGVVVENQYFFARVRGVY